MPARIEKRIIAMTAVAGVAAGGWLPAGDGPVPSNKKWNCNLIFQSTDGAATRNARLALAGGKPAHGLSGLPYGPALVNGIWAISPAGTYAAFIGAGGARVELYRRVGLTGLVFIDALVDTGGGISNIAFSPDERWLSWTSIGFLNVFATAVSSAGFGATATSAVMAAVAQGGSGGDCLIWSPTGAYLAVTTTVAAAAGRVSVYPFAGGVFGARIDAPGMTAADAQIASGPAWAPDESALAILYGQAGASWSVYGWPFAAGVFGAVNRANTAVAPAATMVGLQWCPDASTKMVAGYIPQAGGFPAFTRTWNGAAWGASNNLTIPVAVPVGKLVKWLTSRVILAQTYAAAGGATAIIDLVSSAGVLAANLSNVAALITTGTPTLTASRAYLIDGQLWRVNNAVSSVLVEGLLQPALTLFPLIGITANSRQLIQGLVLEAGDRLLVGTPAATDVFAVSASAIEIG